MSGGWRQTLLAMKLGVPAALGISVPEWQERIGGYVRLSIPERREAVAELAAEGLTTREIGDVLGVHHSTAERDIRAGANAPDEDSAQDALALDAGANAPDEPPSEMAFEPVADTRVEASSPREERKEREEAARTRKEKSEERAVEMAARVKVDIRHGDFRTVLDDLYGTVDAIITDPPYPKDFIEEFDALGEVASRLLKIGGILVVMVGGVHLPEYIERLNRHMKYRWCGAYLTDGPATRVQGRKVGTKWKPLLIYGGERFITQDVFSSDGQDKQHHEWGQSESGMADIVSRLTDPGQLVVDPFLGGGTTAIVCRDLGRNFVGCDIDAAAVAKSLERLK